MKLRRPDIVASLVRLGGILAVISLPFKALPLHFLGWLPIDPSRFTRLSEFIAGLGLIYLASQLHRKKRSALQMTSVLLAFLILLESIHYRHPHGRLDIVFGLILLLLLIERRNYVVRSDFTSLRRNLLIAGGLLLAVAGFVLITFIRIDQREFGRTLTTSQSLSITAHAVAGSPLPAGLSTHRGRDLIFSLQAAIIVSGGLSLLGLFAPITLRRGSSRASRQRAEAIINRYSVSSEDYLKLWPADKHYYFYNDSFVAYGVSRGVAIIVDGATGNPNNFTALRNSFLEECRLNGWQACLIHASETEKQAWEQLGMRAFYMGSEARVEIEEFCKDKARDKHFRYVRNRAEKAGMSVIELPRPLSAGDLEELATVSRAWTESGKHEYRFIMGYFNESYLRKSRVFAVMQAGRIVAYTNIMPNFQDADLSIDHMRSLPDVGGPTMHYLLLEVLLKLRGSNAQTLNLGLAPLSKIEENVSKTYQPLLSAIKTLGGRYYSFAGLEQFKGKFSPDWEPTYLVYSGLPTRLPVVVAAVMALSSYQTTKRLQKYTPWLLTASVVSGLCYASFPAAFVLNPHEAWRDMVSVLGQAGQPYANVFNISDFVSSTLGAMVIIYLIILHRHLPRLIRVAMYALALSNIGNILAAVFILPHGIDIDGQLTMALLRNPEVVAHGTASVINSGGFVVAVICWAVWFARKQGFGWRHLFAAVILVLCSVGFAIGEWYPVTSPTIQRAFIACDGIWFVLFCYDILHDKTSTTVAIPETDIPQYSS